MNVKFSSSVSHHLILYVLFLTNICLSVHGNENITNNIKAISINSDKTIKDVTSEGKVIPKANGALKLPAQQEVGGVVNLKKTPIQNDVKGYNETDAGAETTIANVNAEGKDIDEKETNTSIDDQNLENIYYAFDEVLEIINDNAKVEREYLENYVLPNIKELQSNLQYTYNHHQRYSTYPFSKIKNDIKKHFKQPNHSLITKLKNLHIENSLDKYPYDHVLYYWEMHNVLETIAVSYNLPTSIPSRHAMDIVRSCKKCIKHEKTNYEKELNCERYAKKIFDLSLYMTIHSVTPVLSFHEQDSSWLNKTLDEFGNLSEELKEASANKTDYIYLNVVNNVQKSVTQFITIYNELKKSSKSTIKHVYETDEFLTAEDFVFNLLTAVFKKLWEDRYTVEHMLFHLKEICPNTARRYELFSHVNIFERDYVLNIFEKTLSVFSYSFKNQNNEKYNNLVAKDLLEKPYHTESYKKLAAEIIKLIGVSRIAKTVKKLEINLFQIMGGISFYNQNMVEQFNDKQKLASLIKLNTENNSIEELRKTVNEFNTLTVDMKSIENYICSSNKIISVNLKKLHDHMHLALTFLHIAQSEYGKLKERKGYTKFLFFKSDKIKVIAKKLHAALFYAMYVSSYHTFNPI